MQLRRLSGVFLLLIGTLAFFGSAHAIVNVGVDNTNTYTSDPLEGFQTTGAMMGGMAITAYFSDNSSVTDDWVSLGGVAGQVSNAYSGGIWSIYQSGDTWTNAWQIRNTTSLSITRIVIDAVPGNTVFDIWGNSVGTDGSGLGHVFSVDDDTHLDLNINVTYRDRVTLGASPIVGDLYRYLDIEFLTDLGYNQFETNDELNYVADTDTIDHGGEIPEPGTMILLSTGLVGAFLISRSRRRS
jgi:PEP-CTERM motif